MVLLITVLQLTPSNAGRAKLDAESGIRFRIFSGAECRLRFCIGDQTASIPLIRIVMKTLQNRLPLGLIPVCGQFALLAFQVVGNPHVSDLICRPPELLSLFK